MMGIELEWFILLIICIVGKSVLRKFLIESPAWRLMLKWFITMGITYLLYMLAGHQGALTFVIGSTALAVVSHYLWCKYHDIHPIKASPKEKYYQIRGWKLGD